MRHDRISQGNVSLRVGGVLHHIGLGRHLHGTPIIMLINDLDIRVINATTGEIIRQLTIDPTRRYHGTAAPIGGPRRPYGPPKPNQPNPDGGSAVRDVSRHHTARSEGVEPPTF